MKPSKTVGISGRQQLELVYPQKQYVVTNTVERNQIRESVQKLWDCMDLIGDETMPENLLHLDHRAIQTICQHADLAVILLNSAVISAMKGGHYVSVRLPVVTDAPPPDPSELSSPEAPF